MVVAIGEGGGSDGGGWWCGTERQEWLAMGCDSNRWWKWWWKWWCWCRIERHEWLVMGSDSHAGGGDGAETAAAAGRFVD